MTQLITIFHIVDASKKIFGSAGINRHGVENKRVLCRQRKLGPDHPACFESIHELAVLYKKQERYKEAEKYFLEAINGRRLKLGDTHPHTIESLNNLIALYEAWNKPEKANQWRANLLKTEAKIE